MLTIAIPTYNRPEQLRRCLEALAPQLNEQCRLYISDNHSPQAVAEFAEPILKRSGFTNYSFHRHAVNIGAIGNLIHCLQTAHSSWLWIVGDDDVPLPGAIAHILDSIAKLNGHMLMTFEVREFRDLMTIPAPSGDVEALGLSAFLRSPSLVFGSLISGGVYNMALLYPYISAAFEYSSSYYPHLALLIEALKNRTLAVLHSSKPIVRFIGDGATEVPPAHLISNFRVLTRMLPSHQDREALMTSSFAEMNLKPWKKHMNSPGLKLLILASAFRQTEQGLNVTRWARRTCAEWIEFHQISRHFPLAGAVLLFQLLFATLFGTTFAIPIRVLFRIRADGARKLPPAFDNFRPRLVP